MTDNIQGSDEWFDARRGKVTASRIADVIAKTKSGWGASRANYMAELVAERMTGITAESYTNAAMQRGKDLEPQARAAYVFFTDNEVIEIGFVSHPTIGKSAASPDGLAGDDGMVEIKCPNTATHIETLLTRKIPNKYVVQMQWQMACAGRKWCDFVSFDPRMPGNLQLHVQRVDRDDDKIGELGVMVVGFLGELDEQVAALEALKLDLAAEQPPADA